MVGPELLLLAADGDGGEGQLVLVGGREGDVVGGVPVLADEDMGELRVGLEGVDGGEDAVAALDLQRPALAEVVLRVDDDQCLCHSNFLFCDYIFCEERLNVRCIISDSNRTEKLPPCKKPLRPLPLLVGMEALG